ncbi:MAG: helix-turn-helix transcriptional regulator [Lachnospiraceae bacterium]|nr:helix-turn-helix transcriptional regulator [Lachnospiraceae bacterium]
MKDRIRELREHYGLSQAQFAQRINRSPGFISLVETGRSNLSREVVERICAVYGVDEGWLVNGKGKMIDKAPVDMENIGVRVKKIRKDKKLTQMQFASAIGS